MGYLYLLLQLKLQFNCFTSAAVAVDSSHMTASSSASRSRFSPPPNLVNGRMSTMWFMVCRWPQSQVGDWARPHFTMIRQKKRTKAVFCNAVWYCMAVESSSSYLFTFQQIIQQTHYNKYWRLLAEKPSGSLDWPPIVGLYYNYYYNISLVLSNKTGAKQFFPAQRTPYSRHWIQTWYRRI